jgi:hypothetical protein
MQQNGVPKSAIDCLFSTLQNATHQVRTGYGDSTSYYGGLYWIIPMHGIGQGNGAGPAIWAVLSTPLLNLLCKLGFGCFLISPITNIQKNFVGYSFVDDTDLIHSNPLDTSYTVVIQKMQHSLDTWEGGLKATGGAIVPEKTFWHLIDFKISPGSWRYKSIQECPGSLYVQDINGVHQEIRRFEASHAETTLGVDLAPDGNTLQQEKKMKALAIKWADGMQTGKISPSETWLAITSTIWKTLSYPLPAINLSKRQCENIMAPVLQYGLPALGICRSFPRKLVFAPTKYMGLGLPHLYTIQEISRIKDILTHTYASTTMGYLYQTSLELLLHEIGMGTDLHLVSYELTSNLATNSLIKSTWQFLNSNNLHLQHNVSIPHQRINDRV